MTYQRWGVGTGNILSRRQTRLKFFVNKAVMSSICAVMKYPFLQSSG